MMREEIAYHLEHFAEPGLSGRVFVGPKGTTPHRSHFVVTWRQAKRAAGIPESVHLHDLRHTGNHFAAASGASTRDLMSRMGHSSMRAALIYQHATVERDWSIADALDRLVSATPEPMQGRAPEAFGHGLGTNVAGRASTGEGPSAR
jgi:integrase